MSQLSNTRLNPQARPVDRMILPERVDQNNDLAQLAGALAPFSEKVAAIRDRQLAFSEEQQRKQMEAYATAEAARYKNLTDFQKAVSDGQIKYQDVPWVQTMLKQQVSLNQSMTNMRSAVAEYQNGPLALSDDSEAVKQFFVQKMSAGLDENDPYVAGYVAPHILDRAEKLATQHVQSRSTERRKEILDGVSKTAFDNLDPSVNGIAAMQESLDQYGRFIPASELTAAVMDGVSRRALTSEDLSGPLQALTGLMVTGPDGKRVPLLDSVDAKDRIAKIGEHLDERMSVQVRQGEQAERRKIKNETESIWAQFDKFRETNPGASPLSFKLPAGTSREAAMAYISQAASIEGDMSRLSDLSRKEETKPALKLLADGVVNMGLTPQQALDQRLPDGRTVREVVALNDAAPEVNRIFSLAPQVDEGEVADISSEILAGGQTDGTRLEAIKGQVPRGTYDRLKVQLEKNRISANNVPGFNYKNRNEDPLDGFFILSASIEAAAEAQRGDSLGLDQEARAAIRGRIEQASHKLASTVQALNNDPTLSQAEKTTRAQEALWRISAENGGSADYGEFLKMKKKVEKVQAEENDPSKIKPTDPIVVQDLADEARALGMPPDQLQKVKDRLSTANTSLAADESKLQSIDGAPLYAQNKVGIAYKIGASLHDSPTGRKYWEAIMNADTTRSSRGTSMDRVVLNGAVEALKTGATPDGEYLVMFKNKEDLNSRFKKLMAFSGITDPDEQLKILNLQIRNMRIAQAYERTNNSSARK